MSISLDKFTSIPGKRWSLVLTKPRNEKKALQGLLGNNIIAYLPLITKVEIHNRSKRERYLPMFPGYLFACQTLEEESIIRREKCVWNLRVLSQGEENDLLKDLEIVRESELLSKEHKLTINPSIKEGDAVRLKRGPFKNHDVIVQRRIDVSSVIVNLNFLGRNVEIQCNADDLSF